MLRLLLMMALIALVDGRMYDRTCPVPTHDELMLMTLVVVAAMKSFYSDCWPLTSWSAAAFIFSPSISAKPSDPSATC